ncbi:MAG: Uma2 family endonuclease [Coprococcus sp.]
MLKTDLKTQNTYSYGGNLAMSLPGDYIYTAEDYWNLPEGKRAELIDGQLYDLASPSRIHQRLISELLYIFQQHIKSNKGNCEVYTAPFAVNLNANDKIFVEPDISIICDPDKLSDRGCEGAPDLVIEVVSPGSRRMDYIRKNALYADAGVREYWIVDPASEQTTIYRYEDNDAPVIIPFDQIIQVGIYENLQINIAELQK